MVMIISTENFGGDQRTPDLYGWEHGGDYKEVRRKIKQGRKERRRNRQTARLAAARLALRAEKRRTK